MKLYVAMLEDSHVDVDVEVFTTVDEAIEHAKKWVEEYVRDRDYDWRADYGPDWQLPDGWVFHHAYSVEGHSVRVVERELDVPAAV